jgi:hypothetical protein
LSHFLPPLFGRRRFVSLRFLTVVLGGVQMNVTCPVAGEHRRLLVRRCGQPVDSSRFDMPVRGRPVSSLRALQ